MGPSHSHGWLIHSSSLWPEEFGDFKEPGHVKIAWTIHAHRISATESVASSETQASTAHAVAQAKTIAALAFIGIVTVIVVLARRRSQLRVLDDIGSLVSVQRMTSGRTN